ncbi:MAG: tetratricopeptide repeat protein [Bacteroidia bacterium]|nr:tetratricopeptide repeat protein [Bacteroidia bacterium]
MKKILILIFLLAAIQSGIWAQLSPYQAYLPLYQEAVELFEIEKYGAAQKRLDAFLEFEEDLRAKEENDLHANARYLQAVCAYKLEREDAIELLDKFVREFPENTKVSLAQYYLGKYYFEQKLYSQAVPPFQAAVQSSALNVDIFNEVVYLLGYSYFKVENYPQALRYFDMGAEKENKYQEDAQYYRAILYYKQKDFNKAYEAFSPLKESKKYGRETRVYLANTLLKLKKLDELYTLADELVRGPKIRKEEAQIYYVVANASFEKEDFPKAVSYYGEYKKNKGKLGRIDNYRYGYAYYKGKNYKDAIPLFQKVIKQTATDTLSQVSSYYLGFSLLEENNQDAAKLAFASSAREGKNTIPTITQDGLYQYAKVSFATESYDDALKALQKLIKNYPNATYKEEVKTMIGEVYLFTRNYPAAIDYFEGIQRTSSRAKLSYQTVLYYYGLDLFEKKKLKQAAFNFQKAIDNPAKTEFTRGAHYWKGETYFRGKAYAKAEAAFKKYLNLSGVSSDEYYARGFYGLGWTYFKQKSYTSALNNFKSFIDKAGDNESRKLIVDAHTRVGDCYFLKKNYKSANTYYQKVIDFRYAYGDYAYFQKGQAYYRLRSYKSSVTNFGKLVSSFRKSPFRDNALDRMSDIYANWLSDYQNSLKASSRLVKDYPRSPLAAVAYNRMGYASFKLNDKPNAVRYYKKVLTDYGADKENAQLALDNLKGLVSANEFDKILKDYRKSNPNMNENLAELVLNTGKERFFSGNYSSAASQFSTYIKDYKNGPGYMEALLYRARSYRELNESKKALADYKTIYDATVKNNFTLEALLEAAELSFEEKNFSESLSLYERLEQNSSAVPNRVQALFGIASSQMNLKKYSQAIAALDKIIDNNEAAVESKTQAYVEKGKAQYASKDYQAAMETFALVEQDFKNEYGAESQLMIAQIFLDQGIALKKSGQEELAKGKFSQVIDAVKYFANQYTTYNYRKAKVFLIAAEAYYQMGKVFQAKGTLGSIIREAAFPDIKEQAQKRLEEIEAEEAKNENN